MLADVAQEVDGGHGAVQSRLLTQAPASRPSKSRNRSTWTRMPLDPFGHASRGVERALGARPLGSPTSPVAPPTRPTAGGRPLETAQGQQRDQVADVEARRGRVEAAIERDRALGQRRAQCVDVGGLRDQAAPVEVSQMSVTILAFQCSK